jgi:hypothetical protein
VALRKAGVSHDLALVASDRVDGEAGALAVEERDECRECGEIDELPTPRHEGFAPALRLNRDRPPAILLAERSEVDHEAGPSFP